VRESTFEVELTGRLLFDLEGGHPLYLELEGTLGTEQNTERSRNGVDRTIHVAREGVFSHTVEIRSEGRDE